MRSITAKALFIAAAIAAGLPLVAAADVSIGANAVSSRINEGDFDGRETGWKGYAGASLYKALGVEVGYIDYGRYGVEGTSADAWTPAVTLGIPVGPVNFYGKGGVAFAEFEGTSVRQESKNNDPFFGVGFRVGMNRGLGLRVEYERYRFDTADVDVGMAGLELRFGGEPNHSY
jgi:hypothetical protein